ncbi:MAG: DUF4062 domain-containing protein [Saprospirales bacterium]|nr:DUF4062 domain-containing protein [Saprospirales bacterium]
MPFITTPDQRVRVFISSTLNELAEERKAARTAIGNLRLIPVFFEAGARPHPPRDLYSAYLEQSHIFLGIYWNSYGWVAPGAEISGLEDEYRLCGNRPKLIYVKQSEERQPELRKLLQDVQNSDTACYQKFSDAAELQQLIENDLSVLMSEIFQNALFEHQSNAALGPGDLKIDALPLIRNTIIGREQDIHDVSETLMRPDVSILTLLGTGGTGKTALSIHVAHAVADRFRNGAAFVPLAPVSDSQLTAFAIASTLGLQDSGKQPVEVTLLEFLVDKEMLLVLDNFEQILGASGLVSDISSRCEDVKILVTSRSSLHLRNERIYPLSPLEVPESWVDTREELMKAPAAALYVERAQAVNPGLQLDGENIKAIVEICQRLEGLPLAIELAAARTRFFQPAALLSRIEKALDLVSKGPLDLPERQKTLRAAIEWSYNLLEPETQKALIQLGVFRKNWTMEAAFAVAQSDSNPIDIEETTERLLDASLIKPVHVGPGQEPRFSMLQTVREYAGEILELEPGALETKLRYARYYLQMLELSEDQLWAPNSEPWLDNIENELPNIRASFYLFTENGDYENAWKFFYLIAPYWGVRGGSSEAPAWIEAAKMETGLQLSDAHVKGKALLWASYVGFYLLQMDRGFQLVRRAEEIFRTIGDRANLCFSLVISGGYSVWTGRPEAAVKLDECAELAEVIDDRVVQGLFYVWSAGHLQKQGKKEQLARNLVMANKIAFEHEYKIILANLLHMRLTYLQGREEVAGEFPEYLRTYEALPKKGYQGYKSAALAGCTLALIYSGRLAEAGPYFLKSLEYARGSGQKEMEFFSILAGCQYYGLIGNFRKACALLGALDAFAKQTNYFFHGTPTWEYEQARSLAFSDQADEQRTAWYDQGRKMSLDEVILFGMRD